jgi:hypothetical protein
LFNTNIDFSTDAVLYVKQAFELIVAKCLTLDNAFKYPITSAYLALAKADENLQQSDKAQLRNCLINESTSLLICYRWVAAFRMLPPENNYKLYFEKLIKYRIALRNKKAALLKFILSMTHITIRA